VIDPVGGDRVTDSLRSLAPEGRLVVAGFSGEIPVVKVNRLLLGDTGVLGAASREFSEQQPVTVAGLWDRLLRLWRARCCPILPFSATRSPTPAAPCVRSLTAKPRARLC
jgi:NADPH:quinone reductase-like Zn-dependent oxidoreductase